MRNLYIVCAAWIIGFGIIDFLKNTLGDDIMKFIIKIKKYKKYLKRIKTNNEIRELFFSVVSEYNKSCDLVEYYEKFNPISEEIETALANKLFLRLKLNEIIKINKAIYKTK